MDHVFAPLEIKLMDWKDKRAYDLAPDLMRNRDVGYLKQVLGKMSPEARELLVVFAEMVIEAVEDD